MINFRLMHWGPVTAKTVVHLPNDLPTASRLIETDTSLDTSLTSRFIYIDQELQELFDGQE